MQRNPLAILREHIKNAWPWAPSPSQRAVEVERAIERGGYAIVPNEAAAILSFIVSHGYIEPHTLNRMLIDMKLAEIVPYDPAVHTGGDANMLPGDRYLKYSPGLMEIMARGRSHLAGVLQ